MNWRSSTLALCMAFFGWSQAAATTYKYLVNIDESFVSITGFIKTNTNNSTALSASNLVSWNLSVVFKWSIINTAPYNLSNHNSHISSPQGGDPLFTATPTGLYFNPAYTNDPTIDRSKYNLTFQSNTREDAIQITWVTWYPPTPCCAAWDLSLTGPIISCPSNLGGPCNPDSSIGYGICSYPSTIQSCPLFQIASFSQIQRPTGCKVWWRHGWRRSWCHCWINRWGHRVCRW
jgi:hypothetical protein